MTAPVDASPPLDVALLVSESGARASHLFETDSEAYNVVGAVASHPDGEATRLLESEGVPTETIPIEAFYERRGADLTDMTVRHEYDERVAETLAGFDPDLVACAGYRFVLTGPVLDRFAPGLISVHHADLTLRDSDGEPLYPGLHAVREALLDGRTRTRETAHVVTDAVDGGPPLVVSRPFEVNDALVRETTTQDADDAFDAYVYAHREWMMRAGGGPTLAQAIELLAAGRVDIRDGALSVDGESGPYRMGETTHAREPTDVEVD